MKLKLKLFDSSLPVPAYQTRRAAAFDLYSRIEVTIDPQQVVQVPLNVAMELPAGYWLLLAARSSLYKKGLLLINGIGVGDNDYCGDQDEYRAAVFNFTSQPVKVAKGDRLVQAIIMPSQRAELELVAHLSQPNRGGFGSTG